MQFIHHASLSPLITNLLCFSLSGSYNKADKVPEGYDMYDMAHTASYKQVKGKARKGEEFNPSQIPYNPEQVMISSGGRSRGSIAIDLEIAPETTVSLIWMDVAC